MQKKDIILVCRRLFAEQGYSGFSMRIFAQTIGSSLSALYYYYPSKDELLKDMFNTINTNLGVTRSQIAPSVSMNDMLQKRIRFQFEHAEEVVAVLKYYMHFRTSFPKSEYGYLPEKAHLHIEEVLRFGIEIREIAPLNVPRQSRIITHMINGFVLEYFPITPTPGELDQLTHDITKFTMRSLLLDA